MGKRLYSFTKHTKYGPVVYRAKSRKSRVSEMLPLTEVERLRVALEQRDLEVAGLRLVIEDPVGGLDALLPKWAKKVSLYEGEQRIAQLPMRRKRQTAPARVGRAAARDRLKKRREAQIKAGLRLGERLADIVEKMRDSGDPITLRTARALARKP